VETVRKLLHLESAVLKLPGLPSEYDIILTAGRIFVYGTPIEDIQVSPPTCMSKATGSSNLDSLSSVVQTQSVLHASHC
jgi:hypothetical protein